MNRLSLLALAFALLPLTACSPKSTQTPDSYDLSGTVSGNWPAGSLRLALVGTGLPNIITNTSTLEQNIVTDASDNRSFGLDLPSFPDVVGIYQVIAFVDANNNARYDVGETFARNRQYLIFSPKGGAVGPLNIPAGLPGAGEEAIPALNVAQGWNVYDRAQPVSSSNPKAGSKVTGYDLTR